MGSLCRVLIWQCFLKIKANAGLTIMRVTVNKHEILVVFSRSISPIAY